MSHSINWNGNDLSSYLRITWPEDILNRLSDIIQVQDRAFAGKGQAGPRTMTFPVIIEGTSLSNLNSNIETARGYLDQEDECELIIDGISDRYWMAMFRTLEGAYTSSTTWQGVLVFLCSDPKAYGDADSHVETLDTNISAGYGGAIVVIDYDADEEAIYVGGATTNKVYKLSAIDLTKLAESDSYGNLIECICHDTDNVFIAGDIIDKVWKLDKDLTKIAEGPAYGGVVIHSIAEYGDYIYYGGNGGVGQYDVCKLQKADMTTIIRSADKGGVIYCVAVNATHVVVGSDADGDGHYHVNRYLSTDLSYVDQSDDMTNVILSLAIDATNCYWCGSLQEVWYAPLANLAGETQSGDLGNRLPRLAIDDDYIYVCCDDGYIYKLDIAFAASASYLAKSADYGGVLNAIAIDTTNQRLYIGGETTETVWKLDSRHFNEIWQTESVGDQAGYSGRVTCEKDGYIYTVGSWVADEARVLKIRKSDGLIVARSIVYTNKIYAICADNDGHIFVAGEYAGPAAGVVWKLSADDLEFLDEGPAYSGTIYCLCCDSTNGYVYYGGDGGAAQYDICKLLISDMTTIVRGPDYGGIIYCCCCDEIAAGFIYYGGDGGAGEYDMCKLLKSDMTTIVRSADYGSAVFGCDTDGTYIYYGGDGGAASVLTQTDIATMAVDVDSEALGGDINSVRSDATYTFASTSTTNQIFKLLNADMTTIAKTGAYGSAVYGIEIDDGFLYAQNTTDECVDKLDNRILWIRADHEFTVTNAGTSKAEPIITLVANGANYWQQKITNSTNSQEFTWEGTQADTETLEIDSEYYTVELEGETAMYGQDGDFIKLNPGANTIVTENIVGDVSIDWTDRYA